MKCLKCKKTVRAGDNQVKIQEVDKDTGKVYSSSCLCVDCLLGTIRKEKVSEKRSFSDVEKAVRVKV